MILSDTMILVPGFGWEDDKYFNSSCLESKNNLKQFIKLKKVVTMETHWAASQKCYE